MGRLVVSVMQDRPNTYESKKRGQVKERILTLLDMDMVEGEINPDTEEYVLKPEEEKAFPEGSLIGKKLDFASSGRVVWNGKFRLRGHILRDQLPGGPRDVLKAGK